MEIEMKIWLNETDLPKIERFVKARQSPLSPPKTQLDVYFKERGFRTKPQGPGSYLVRVRYMDNVTTLTMKRLTDRDGVWEEVETRVDSGDVVERVIDALGAERAVRFEKIRRECSIDGLEVIVDEVTDLGTFLEVAIEGPAEDIEASQARLRALIRSMDIDESRIERRGYPTILLEREGVTFLVK